jgi:hypothetical protein
MNFAASRLVYRIFVTLLLAWFQWCLRHFANVFGVTGIATPGYWRLSLRDKLIMNHHNFPFLVANRHNFPFTVFVLSVRN